MKIVNSRQPLDDFFSVVFSLLASAKRSRRRPPRPA
jgi:hypothetical protein